MKLVTIVGARPQFIKAWPVSQALREAGISEYVVHTGQHYDFEMCGVFYQELDIPQPSINLGVGSGPHGRQTGAMLERIEAVLLEQKPDWVLVYGDTNSTLAGGLAATKLHFKLAHVEAGLRSFNRRMPEEINRVLTDHCSDVLLCPTQTAVENLKSEGITKGVHLVGDVMHDAHVKAKAIAREKSRILETLGLKEKSFLLATIHRAENTDDPHRLSGIMTALAKLSQQEPVVLPVHPRTQKALKESKLLTAVQSPPANVQMISPVGYLAMLQLEQAARLILTDSGGVQKEAFWVQTPCVTLRDETEWVETLSNGWNQLAGANSEKILAAVSRARGAGSIQNNGAQTAALCAVQVLASRGGSSLRE